MTTQAELLRVLRGLQSRVEGVEGVVVATRDGLPVASTAPEAGTGRLAAMAASVLALAHEAIHDPDTPDSGQTVIRGSDGCMVVQSAGPLAVVAVQTSARPNIGLIQVEVPQTADQLAALLA